MLTISRSENRGKKILTHFGALADWLPWLRLSLFPPLLLPLLLFLASRQKKIESKKYPSRPSPIPLASILPSSIAALNKNRPSPDSVAFRSLFLIFAFVALPESQTSGSRFIINTQTRTHIQYKHTCIRTYTGLSHQSPFFCQHSGSGKWGWSSIVTSSGVAARSWLFRKGLWACFFLLLFFASLSCILHRLIDLFIRVFSPFLFSLFLPSPLIIILRISVWYVQAPLFPPLVAETERKARRSWCRMTLFCVSRLHQCRWSFLTLRLVLIVYRHRVICHTPTNARRQPPLFYYLPPFFFFLFLFASLKPAHHGWSGSGFGLDHRSFVGSEG